LEQINNQITSLQNEAQMLINQARNLTSLPTSMLDQIEGNFSQMKSLLGEADQLAYSVREIDSQFTSAYQNFGSDLSGQQLVDGARERWRTSVSAFEHSLKAGAVAVDNIDGTQQQTSALVGASQSAVGVLQATQAGNQLLAVQAKQVADLTAMLAAQGRAEALEKARQAAAQEQAREQFSRFMTGSSYSPSSVKMFHD
ncbi:P-type conjugative transfer protein TrbJ, partial [Mesorhizobium sp. M7A.F.Ca.US.005.03.1.1]|uniref:P-type conjugative transfer protein TrbJ n=2 Tax=unclassified Mesorhizobium TaxID=325217 RepID=UPI000FCC9D2F